MLSFYLSLVTNEEDNEIIIYIYRNYYSQIASAVASELGDSQYVEDVVHNVMLTLIDIIEKIDYSDRKKLKHLCILIAKRRAIDFKRKSSNADLPIEEYQDDSDICSDSPEEIIINNEAYEKIKSSFDQLDYIYKEVCQLRFIYSMKLKDIAKLLNVSEVLVSTRIFRARQKLAEILKKEGFDV